MNKRLIILIIVLVILIVGAGAWWWFSRQERGPSPSAPIPEPNQTFPVSPPLSGLPAPGPAPEIEAGNTSSPTAPAGGQAAPARQSKRLTSLSDRAVADAIIIPAATATESDHLIFVEQDTGAVVEMTLADQENQEKKILGRIAAGPVGKTYLAPGRKNLSIWFSKIVNQGESYFRATLPFSSTTTNFGPPEIVPELLPGEISAIATAPDGKQFFTLEQVGGESLGQVLNLETNKKLLIFQSKFNQWSAAWPAKNLIALTTKPASRAPGYLYFLNLPTGRLEKIIGGLNGLTALASPDGQRVLYSRSAGRGLELGLYDRMKNESRVLTVATLPEKCAWAADSGLAYCAAPRSLPPADYPDDWLRGEIFFDDLLWQIDGATGASRLIWADEPGLGDVINLLPGSNNRQFVFTDRTNGRLYLIPGSTLELVDGPPIHDQ